MKSFLKYTAAVALTGAIALAAASPSEARNGRNTAAAIGFGAGALFGAAVANSNNGYYGPRYNAGPGYAYEPSYVYEPGYAYEPDYAPDYAYAPRYRAPSNSSCTVSPSSVNFRPCN